VQVNQGPATTQIRGISNGLIDLMNFDEYGVRASALDGDRQYCDDMDDFAGFVDDQPRWPHKTLLDSMAECHEKGIAIEGAPHLGQPGFSRIVNDSNGCIFPTPEQAPWPQEALK
jgi:hypothetical protein